MKIKKHAVVPILIFVIVVLWMLSGIFSSPEESSVSTDTTAPFRVRTLISEAEDHPLTLTIQGQTAAARIVELKAQIDGTIESLDNKEGQLVPKDTIIAKIALDNRTARLEAAKRLVERRKLEYDASQKLLQRGFEPRLEASLIISDLANAEQLLDAIQKEVEKANVKTPFKGIIDKYYVEVGDFLNIGENIARFVELDPLVVEFYVPEQYVERLKPDTPVTVQSLTGITAEGKISLIGSIADPKTRTFPVEVRFPNPKQELRDGLTAKVTTQLDQLKAHKIAPSTLSLATDGTLGVKTIDKQNRVVFIPVQLVDESQEGYWVTGLPDQVRLITDGHEYVEAGSTVEPDEDVESKEEPSHE